MKLIFVNRYLATSVTAAFLISTCYGQTTGTTTQPAPLPITASAISGKPTLLDGTAVKLRTSRNLSSENETTGATVDFEVLEEVKVGDVVVIQKGGVAIGTITQAQAKRRMGRAGKLDMTIDYVRLVDTEKAALRGVKETKGGGHTGAMTGAIVATSLVLWPAAPLFLLMHGKDITIPKGTEITAYINGDLPLNLHKFEAETPSQATPASAMSSEVRIEISSTPTAADIEIDGSFMGNTPSSVGVSIGEHSIKISKAGFVPWEKKLKTTSGTIKVSPDLETQK